MKPSFSSRSFSALLVVAVMLMLLSCGKLQDKKLITERIQYDVTIKSPDPDWDWWIQNLEGSKREAFIKMILNVAYNGNVQSYDYYNKPLNKEDVKGIGNWTDTLVQTSPYPPYNDTTVVVPHHLNVSDIVRIRFLEEWSMNEKTLQFSKKVLGIAPVKEVYNEDGTLRGYQPLFWVYLDQEYPGKLPEK